MVCECHTHGIVGAQKPPYLCTVNKNGKPLPNPSPRGREKLRENNINDKLINSKNNETNANAGLLLYKDDDDSKERKSI